MDDNAIFTDHIKCTKCGKVYVEVSTSSTQRTLTPRSAGLTIRALNSDRSRLALRCACGHETEINPEYVPFLTRTPTSKRAPEVDEHVPTGPSSVFQPESVQRSEAKPESRNGQQRRPQIIDSVFIKPGTTATVGRTRIPGCTVTIFVGPNNSGKSLLLRELHSVLTEGHKKTGPLLIDEVILAQRTESEALNELRSLLLLPEVIDTHASVTLKAPNFHATRELSFFLELFKNPSIDRHTYSKIFLGPRTLLLGGAERIKLVDDRVAGDFLKPENSFASLFVDDNSRGLLRRIIHAAFGKYLVIDPTNSGKLRLRLSGVEPSSDSLERGFHKEACEFHKAASLISEFSDGVKAFCGMLVEVFAGERKIILIDEPEAFLHPTLSAQIGKELAALASTRRKQIFVSTHSPGFLMGCIQSGADISVVRLTYENSTGTSKLLSFDKLQRLMHNPLLRSTGVISGLFFQTVVVTEADSDRAFYEEINERLAKYTPTRSIPGALFINAHGKDTISDIVRPLREMGVCAAIIVDIDVIKNGGQTWTRLLSSVGIPAAAINGLSDLRLKIKSGFEAAGLDMKKCGGVFGLSQELRLSAEHLFDSLAEYGLFVVRGGELESWLKELHIPEGKHGPGWLTEIFVKMGSDVHSDDYLKPRDSDVWSFIDGASAWARDDSRKGMQLFSRPEDEQKG